MSQKAASFSSEYDTGVRNWRRLELAKTARKIVQTNTWIQPGETVAIVCDPETSPLIVEALATEVYLADGVPVVVTFPGQGVHGNEPPASVAAAMEAADAIYGVVSKSLSHTVALQKARRKGVRYLGFSNITEDAFLRGAATADWNEVHEIGEFVRNKLVEADRVRVTSTLGTDVSFSVKGRRIGIRDGVIPRGFVVGGEDFPDNGRMFPDGETNCCPLEDSVDGAIVVDRWIQGIGLLSAPVTWVFEGGKCVEITGGTEAERLNKLIESEGDENSRHLGEFAVGLNPQARLDGNPHREGKKILGSVHFALGTGVVTGGKLQSTLHLDGLLTPPKIYADGKLFFDEGHMVG